eukprot:14822838-Alexandrium_andersonii.AAC.1
MVRTTPSCGAAPRSPTAELGAPRRPATALRVSSAGCRRARLRVPAPLLEGCAAPEPVPTSCADG